MVLPLPVPLLRQYCLTILLALTLPGSAAAQAHVPAGLGELLRRELELASAQGYVVLQAPSLAGFHFRAGAYVLAEPLQKQRLDAEQKRFGQMPDEPSMARNLQQLALLYQEQARLDDALPLLSRALVLEERTAGAAHADVATALSLLAGLQMRRGQYAEAEALYRRSLAVDRAALGERHPVLAATTGNLGISLALQRRFVEAEPLLREALARHQTSAGVTSADALQAARNLGVVLTQQGRTEEGSAWLAGLLLLVRATPAGLPPLLAQDLQQLAAQYAARSERQSAESLYKRALHVTQLALGPSHPAGARIQLELGKLYARLALHALAAQQYQQALAVLSGNAAADPGLRAEIAARLALLPVTGDDRP